MKIFIINNVYKKGSTGKIVYDTKSYLEYLGHKVWVAYGMGKNVKEPNTLKYCTTLERYAHSILCKVGYNPYKGSPITVKRIARAIKMFNPDIVHVHCMNSYCINLYDLLDFLSSNDYKVVVTHHAEFYYTGSCSHAYECTKWISSKCNACSLPNTHRFDFFNITHNDMWLKMNKCFSNFSKKNLVFTAVSPWVKKRVILSPITNKYECITVMNGLDTSVFHFIKNGCFFNKGRYTYVAFHATASFTDKDYDYKGGKFVIELAKLNPSILFIVAALHTNIGCELPPNIMMLGVVGNSNDLAKHYSSADITIITSRRETFSMITAESLCCGTPVVGFEAGGPETIAIKQYTQFVEYGDVQKLNQAMHSILNLKLNKEDIAFQATSLYSKEKMASCYLKVYNDLLIK